MKILLLVPFSSYSGNIVRDVLYGCWASGDRIGGGTVPPLNLLTIATILRDDGNEVILIDALNERIGISSVKRVALGCDVVILLTSTMSAGEDFAVLHSLKESNKNIKSIICGSHPTFMTEQCLDNESVDITIRKEPDFSIRDVIRALNKGGVSWKDTAGIAFRENGRIRINPDYPLIEDLNEIPIADRRFLPNRVRYFNPLIKKYPYTTTSVSRGCAGRCAFCTVPYFYGGKIRAWTVSKVIDEIKYLINFGFKEIYYRDETFTFNKNRTLEICEEILKKNLKFSWLCNVRVGTVDLETLLLMKKAGCRLIKVGVESGVQSILDKSKKGIKIEQSRDLFQWVRRAKITTHAHLMFGMPGEDKNSLEETISFIKKINPNTIDIGICTPYPGSGLFEELSRERPEFKAEAGLDFNNLHTRGLLNRYFANIEDEDLERGLKKAYRSFYLRPSYLARRLGEVKSLSELSDLITAGIKIFNFSLSWKI